MENQNSNQDGNIRMVNKSESNTNLGELTHKKSMEGTGQMRTMYTK